MAEVYDITIDQGSTWSLSMTWKNSAGVPIDLTGYTARMKVRAKHGDTDTLMSLTQADGISLGGVNGTVTLLRTDALTAAFTWPRGVYDLELVSGAGVVTRLLEGAVIVKPEVTT